jgi:hypothetical protein
MVNIVTLATLWQLQLVSYLSISLNHPEWTKKARPHPLRATSPPWRWPKWLHPRVHHISDLTSMLHPMHVHALSFLGGL